MIEFFDTLGAGAPIARALCLTGGAILWTVLLVRIVGLRAFSKMTSFDFVSTIATGSLIAQAGTRTEWSGYWQAMAAIAGVFLIQWVLALASKKSERVRRLLKNQPVLLVDNGEFLESAMAQTRVSRTSILEKLRASNVLRIADAGAVVLETTGDISVLTSRSFDRELLDDVRRI